MTTDDAAEAESAQKNLYEQHMLKLYLQLILEIRSLRAHQVQFETAPDGLRISFLGPEESDGSKVLKVLSAPAAAASQILTFLLDRAYYWSDPDDELFASNPGKVKRLMAAPASQARMLADLAVIKKPGNPASTILLSNIQLDNIRPLQDLLILSDASREQLDRALKCRSGLILAGYSGKPHVVDAAALMIAMRPDACLFKHATSERMLGEALALAESNLVVVGVSHDDPIEMALNAMGLLSAKQELVDEFCKHLVMCFVHTRIRRVCTSCARSTPVDPRTLDRLPIQLRARTKNTYMFGRGCEICGHNAYRGTVGLSSLFVVDEEIRESLRSSSTAAQITRHAYSKGTRSLLEDGLNKIFTGLTSFEEVFSVTTKISAAFAGAIAAEEKDVSAGDLDLEAIEGDSFLSNDPLFASAAQVKTKRRVLIVEDDTDQRAVLEAVFRTEGYEVYGADNGQTAMTSLQVQPVDLIVCDVMMPVMNGVQFVKELRQSPSFKHTPVLMLTAIANPEAECALLSHGADDYCEKNVKKKVLLKRAEKLLAKKPKNPLEHMLSE